MAELAHQREDVLDHLRAGHIAVSPALLNACFGAVDDLARLLQIAVRGDPLPAAPQSRLHQLRALLAPAAPVAPTSREGS